MRKSIYKILTTILATNLLFLGSANIALAENVDPNTPATDPGTDTTVPTTPDPNPTDPDPGTTAPTDPGTTTPEPTEPTTTTTRQNTWTTTSTTTVEVTEPPIYTTTPPVYPEPEPDDRYEIPVQEETSVEEIEEIISPNLANLNGIFAYSIKSQEFVLAWEDFQFIQDNYLYHDLTLPEEIGTSLQEFTETFEGNGEFEESEDAYGHKILVAEYTEDMVDAEEEIVDEEQVEDAENSDLEPSRIILTFNDEDLLIGTGIYLGESDYDELEGIHPALVANLIDQPVESLHDQLGGVYGIYQAMIEGSIFTSILAPTSLTEGESEVQDPSQEELILVNSYQVYSHETIPVTEDTLPFPLLSQERLYVYLSSQYGDFEIPEMVGEGDEAVEEASEESLEDSSEESVEETSEAVSEETSEETPEETSEVTYEDTTTESTVETTVDTTVESTETSQETTEATQETTQETQETTQEVEVDQDFMAKYAPQEEIPQDKLYESRYLERGYQTLKSRVINGELNQNLNDILNAIGRPSVEVTTEIGQLLSYYSIEDNQIILLEIQVTQNGKSVDSMRYETRTPRIEEDFPIDYNDLVDFASQNLDGESLSLEIGEPTVIEHTFQDGETLRYLWTSLTDPEIRNIELVRNKDTGKYELYYFSQPDAESKAN